MKARFVCEQQPVRIVSTEKHDYIFICLNCVEGNEIYTDNDNQEYTQHYYEYDYAELIVLKGKLDLENVQAYPEKYLDYVPEKEKTEQFNIEDRLEAIEKLLLDRV